MKRLITLLFITALCLTSAFAQMTDDQVIEYAKAQTEAGKDQKSIAMELLNKGVTQDQLARIRNNVQRKQNTQNTTTGKETVDNMRVNNAEEVKLDFDIPEDATRKIFGHDIFRSKNLSFEPNMNIATPSTYTLGPGDEVVLDIYGALNTVANAESVYVPGVFTSPITFTMMVRVWPTVSLMVDP